MSPLSHSLAIEPPELCDPETSWLAADSTLAMLPSWQCAVELDKIAGSDLAAWFARYPSVPGAIIVDQGVYVGMVARSRLLELAILPHGVTLLAQPLRDLQLHLCQTGLILPVSLPIPQVVQRLLARSSETLSDPAIVQDGNDYRLVDARDLQVADWQIRGIEAQVRYERMQLAAIQNDKMAALGRLVDGIAHQILEPVGFIWGNLGHVADYGDRAAALIEAYQAWLDNLGVDRPHHLTDLESELDLAFLREDLPKTLASLRNGAQRLKSIVSSLQNFCHLDEVYPKPADLHQHLDSVILLLQSRLRARILIERHYSHLPPVPCYIGQLERLFMMILTRAVDGLLDRAARQQALSAVSTIPGHGLGHGLGPEAIESSHDRPLIKIATEITRDDRDRDLARVTVMDNGPSLGAVGLANLREVFGGRTPTTQETDWAACYHIVTARHGGGFSVLEAPNGGTIVEVLLPLY